MPTTHEEYGMFDSGAWGDRYVSQVFWEKLLDNMLHTGVIVNTGTEAQLSATSPAGMSCNLSNFDALIKGYFYSMTGDPKTLTFDAPGSDPRYDLIVLRLERESDRKMSVYVLKGTESVAPTYPELTRTDDDVYEVALWACLIQSTDTTLNLAETTSLIGDPDYCGEFDLNYRAVASGALIHYSTDYTFYDPTYYNRSTPASTSWDNCSKWMCKNDDYVIGIDDGIYIFVHDREADVTEYIHPTHDTYTLSLYLGTKSYSRPVIVDGKVYIPGGKINVDASYKRLLIYDIADESITYSAQIPTPNSSPFTLHVRLVTYGGNIYVFGIQDTSYAGYVYKYDVALDSWTLVSSLTMTYDIGSGIQNYRRFIVGVDETTGTAYVYAYVYKAVYSTYTYIISSGTLTCYIDSQIPPLNGRGDFCSPDENPSVYYNNKVLYFTGKGYGDFGYKPDEGAWVPTVGSTYGVGCINVETGLQSAGPLYSLGRLDEDYDKIFIDQTAILGATYLSTPPSTAYHNKFVYLNPMPLIGTSDKTVLCQVSRASTTVTFKNFTTGKGYLGKQDAVVLKVGDQYGLSVYDKGLAGGTSVFDTPITFNVEVIGAN
jgi:hypothetical protein